MADTSAAVATQSVGDATAQVVVIAFDLVGQEAANFPTLLENSLNDKRVQDAIQSALDTFMLKRMTSGQGTQDMTSKDAQDLLNAIANSAGGKLGDAALQQIKKSPEYKRLEKAIADFQLAVKTSPMGVWVDHNKGLVFITGLALVIGGAAVLFATKTGGLVTDVIASQIKGKPFQIFKVGKFTVQGQILAFQPDKQTMGAGVVATENWKSVQVSVSLGIIAAGETVQQVNGSVVLKTNDVNIGVTASDTLTNKKINLGLTLGFEDGPLKPLKVGVGAVVSDGKVTGGSLDASLKTSVGDFGLKGQASGKDYQGMATWSIPF